MLTPMDARGDSTRLALTGVNHGLGRQFPVEAVGVLHAGVHALPAWSAGGRGSFYTHFAGKEDLLAGLLQEVATASDECASMPAHSSDFSDPDAIRYHIAAYWHVHQEHAATMRTLSRPRWSTRVSPGPCASSVAPGSTTSATSEKSNCQT
ncbi:TetR/AcrR family transcriptional regulator [Frankia sp. AgPm24]|uniref:TetR/AcrR family transcriptional regulator n=1 Tax=Frankia sp. AgPm24 TaxID=631128 RepID=UPI00200EBF27|nr:TetR/AcrR family transcriptional regulator [Frankia sp. AgPm24]